MKRLFFLSPILLFLFFITGCSKSNGTTPPPAPAPAPAAPAPPAPAPTDYSTFIKEKTWWGNLTNPGEKSQFYSVHFNADLSLVWNQASGEYFGSWALDGNHLVVIFTTIAVTVRADIAKDSTLTNITCSNTSTINSGKMLGLTSKPLIGTTWSGTYSDGKTLRPFALYFDDAVDVNVILNNIPNTYHYVVTTSGVVFRTTNIPGSHALFGLNNKDGQWVGTDLTPDNTWTVIKL
jgi:hypothetical protein